MKKLFLFIVLVITASASLFAQEKMYIYKSDKISLGAYISSTDSLSLSNDFSTLYLSVNGSISEFPVSTIDSVTFGENSYTVTITYSGNSVSVINPLAFEGVSVAVDGAEVTVTSTTDTKDINYLLTGTTSNGMFKIYSEKRFNLLLNGVDITNSDGPAINIQSSKKVTVNLASGTTNILTDGTTYATATLNSEGEAEDQDATFFSEGKLAIEGTGSLTINGKGTDKNALGCDDVIEISSGTVTIASASNDGIHGKDGVEISNGTVNVSATGDAIDGGGGYILITGGSITTTNSASDAKGIACDSILNIEGGTINMTLSGSQSKGIKSGQLMTLSGGTIIVTNSGGVALTSSGSGYDPSYSTGIKCDTIITINGAAITIKCTGIAGKGISSNYDINMTSGSLNVTTTGAGATYKNSSGKTDAYSSACITSDKNVSLLGGTITLSSSGSGGKGISTDGTLTIGDTSNSPTISITTTGSKFTVSSSDYCHPKTIVCTGAITINNGTTTISSSDDGMHSETSITQNGGTVTISTSVEGVESKYIYINDGSISVYASNDAFNATAGTTSGGTETSDGSCLYLKGGYVMASCTGGDGLDSNGNIQMSGGTVVVHGPTNGVEEAADFNGTFTISGGFLIASGTSSTMNKTMSSSSTQNGLYAKTSSAIAANTIFRIQNSSGTDIVTFKALRPIYSILFSSSSFANGTYYIYSGGTCTGTVKDGLYTGGTYSGGTQKKSFTVSSKVTSISF